MPVLESSNPARPAEVLGQFEVAGRREIDRAVASATRSQREWARRPVPARAEVIDRCGRLLAERKPELTALVTQETGKILAEAGGELSSACPPGSNVSRLPASRDGVGKPLGSLAGRVKLSSSTPIAGRPLPPLDPKPQSAIRARASASPSC